MHQRLLFDQFIDDQISDEYGNKISSSTNKPLLLSEQFDLLNNSFDNAIHSLSSNSKNSYSYPLDYPFHQDSTDESFIRSLIHHPNSFVQNNQNTLVQNNTNLIQPINLLNFGLSDSSQNQISNNSINGSLNNGPGGLLVMPDGTVQYISSQIMSKTILNAQPHQATKPIKRSSGSNSSTKPNKRTRIQHIRKHREIRPKLPLLMPKTALPPAHLNPKPNKTKTQIVNRRRKPDQRQIKQVDLNQPPVHAQIPVPRVGPPRLQLLSSRLEKVRYPVRLYCRNQSSIEALDNPMITLGQQQVDSNAISDLAKKFQSHHISAKKKIDKKDHKTKKKTPTDYEADISINKSYDIF